MPQLSLRPAGRGSCCVMNCWRTMACVKWLVALGVIRAVEAPVYGEELYKQMEAVQTKKPNLKLNDILMSGEVWQVKE